MTSRLKYPVMPRVPLIVFVFQEDTFYPHPSSKRLKLQAKMIQYVYDQDTIGSWNNVVNPSDKWNDFDWTYYLIVFYT